MNSCGKLAIGVIVGVALAVAAWVFGAGGAFVTAMEAHRIAVSAVNGVGKNKERVSRMEGTIETHHTAIMRELDQVQITIGRIDDHLRATD